MNWSLIISLIIGYSYADYVDNDDTIGYAGMASATNWRAADAAKKILRNGGNAADAAFAAQMVLNVVQPQSAGIGGGAFIMYYDAASKEVFAIDAREEAPAAYNEYVFCDDVTCYETNGTSGDCDSCAAINFWERRTGGLSVGVPGTLAGFTRLIQEFGSNNTEWAELFDDAIDYAQNGYTAYQEFVDGINLSFGPFSVIGGLSKFNSSCKLLLNYPYCNESKYEVGDTVTNPDLGQFFANLSAMEPDEALEYFYKGAIAEAIVEQTKSAINPTTGRNGVMELEDMEMYRAVFRQPISSVISFDDEDYTFYGMPMPSSGPLTVQYQLKLNQLLQTEYNNSDVDEFEDDATSAQAAHYIYSLQNIAFADRNQYMADQDFVNVPVEGLIDNEYIRGRGLKYINTSSAQILPIPYGKPEGFNDTFESSTANESGTAHINVVDKDGNIACITTTIESGYGSFVVLDGYGFFLNNELTDFNSNGIVNGIKTANAPEGGKKYRRTAVGDDAMTMGGKRPRSSMSPTIVFKSDGSPYMTVGARGGSMIIGEVFRVLQGKLQYDMNIQSAVNVPRVFGRNSDLRIEQLWLDANTNITEELMAKYGYDSYSTSTTGSCNAIVVGDDNLLYCGKDTTRFAEEGCSPVCNSTDSTCPFAITTAYPESTTFAPETNITDDGLDDICDDSDDYTWIIKAIFRIIVSDDFDIVSDEGREIFRNACKQAFFRSIADILDGWLDGFCFDLFDDELSIEEYTSTSRRRLLTTEYEIEAGFEYNDDLQDAFFSDESLYNASDFGEMFGEELVELLIDGGVISNMSSIVITFEAAQEYIPEDEPDHKVEGALVNATVIMGLVDVLLFLACMVYLIRNTYPRVNEDGDIEWKEAKERYKLPFSIAFIEVLGSLIHWVFAIIVIARHESYLGWILFCLLLAGEVVLYVRFVMYKQLILYQIPKLKEENKLTETELTDAIIARKTDIAILGILLGTVEDLPVLIICIIVGENFGYDAGVVLALLIAIVSLIMKLGLVFGARCGSTDDEPLEKVGYVPVKKQNKSAKEERATKEAIELAEEIKDDEKKGLKNTNEVEEEEEEEEKAKDQDGDDAATGNAEEVEQEQEKEKQEEKKPLNTDDNKEEETDAGNKKEQQYVD